MDKKTYSEIKLNFEDNYFKHIKPQLEKYEKIRQKNFKLVFWLWVPILSIAAIATIIIPILAQENVEIDLRVTLFLIVIQFVIYSCYGYSLEAKMKENFMPNICKCFNNLTWKQTYRSKSNEFYNIGLVDYYNDETIDDVFVGKYNGVKFEIIETYLKKITRGKHRSVRKIFRGVILKIHHDEAYKTHTVLRPDNLFKFDIQDLKHTELEDVVFEKKFDVFTDDEVQSRVILSPLFMERLNNIQKIFEAQKVSCAFYGFTTYIALSVDRDMFNVCSLIKPVNTPVKFVKMFDEIISVYKLIDYLKLTKEETKA